MFDRAPVLVNELWGAKFFGSNFTAIGFGPAVGSYLLGTLMAGKIYESHTKVEGTSF
jgi:hypothetical protein